MNPRLRPLAIGAGVLLVAWTLAWIGYTGFRDSRPTADRLFAYLRGHSLASLDSAARAATLQRLAELLNGLPAEERRKARLGQWWSTWWKEMTEDEKAAFVEATVPAGLQQMLSAFEGIPAERRRKAVDDALRRLREARDQNPAEGEPGAAGEAMPGLGGGPFPEVSDAVRDRVAAAGLKAFYSESTAQTKAELAPVLEELQSMMESGRMRGRMRPEGRGGP
ncbi:MAG: hypothetical protein IT580_22615 [Verrucomicrobiales bacterium]|nr:hypothetical protein [Verrucomicrobiales bacterium]